MASPATPPRGAVETLRVRQIDGRFAFVSLRVDGWSITGVMVQRTDAGHRITWPTSEARGRS